MGVAGRGRRTVGGWVFVGVVAFSGAASGAEPRTTAIVGATVFDATGAAPHVANVVIRDGRIVAVGSKVRAPRGAVLDATGDAWVVESQMTANLYGQYEFTDGLAANTRLRLGVRNLTNEKPPLESENGFLGALYQPYSRYWYVSVRKTF
ncbi:TonB-dependent receptor [Phenylobacterium sp.]|uniref:TonB-dependent receptor n=1 Tax=Phenylobacterium sp. TaxID=1871053 RepID=UPI002737884D|nr:TonB-dependent receptor [Phenylobacterium sp.]MDP3867535.1 TonB-dependent receptor [Phenylobacterium sp.]